MIQNQQQSVPGLVVKFHRVGASSWWTLPWTNVQFNESTAPGYGAFTCTCKSPPGDEFAAIRKVPGGKHPDTYLGPWPVPGDWYTIESNFQTVAFGRVMVPAVRVENQPSGAASATVTVSGISWFDYIRQLPIYVNWLGASVSNVQAASSFVEGGGVASTPWSEDEAGTARISSRGIVPSSYMPLDSFLTLAARILTQGSQGNVGPALQTYLDAVTDLRLPESLGGGSLREHVVVVHDAITSKAYAPGWVHEGITSHGLYLTNIGGNFFEANIGAIIDSTFAIDPAWVDLFPVLLPLNATATSQSVASSLWQKLGARLCVVYRTKPFRYRPLSKDVKGDTSTIAKVFENKTFDISDIQADGRVIPAEYIRSDYEYRKSQGDMVNLGVVHTNGFGASDPNMMQQSFGLPLIQPESIRRNGVFRSTIKWPFIPNDKSPGDLEMFVRALAAGLMQMHGNGDKYRNGMLQVPFIFTQKGNPWVERERSRQLIPLYPGQHFGFSQEKTGRIMYAYCTGMSHSVMRSPNGSVHSATGISFVRGMYEDEVEDIASCKVDLTDIPLKPKASGGKALGAQKATVLNGFLYRGKTYPLLSAGGVASGKPVSYSQLRFKDGSVGSERPESQIVGAVLHSSTSAPYTSAESLIRSFQSSFLTGVKPRCTHFLIDATGAVWQDLDVAATSYHTSDGEDFISSRTVGIELIHPVSPSLTPSGWTSVNTKAGAFRTAVLPTLHNMPSNVSADAPLTIVDMRGSEHVGALQAYPLYSGYEYRELVNARGQVVRRLAFTNFLMPTRRQLNALYELLRGLYAVLPGMPKKSAMKPDGVVRAYTDIAEAKAVVSTGGLFIHTEVYPGHVDVLGVKPADVLRRL